MPHIIRIIEALQTPNTKRCHNHKSTYWGWISTSKSNRHHLSFKSFILMGVKCNVLKYLGIHNLTHAHYLSSVVTIIIRRLVSWPLSPDLLSLYNGTLVLPRRHDERTDLTFYIWMSTWDQLNMRCLPCPYKEKYNLDRGIS